MVATRQVTVEEFAEMPLQGIWELVDGQPIELSPAAGRSGWISGNILALLANHVRQSDLGWAFPPGAGFVLFADRQTVRSPDVAVVLRGRLAALPDSFIPLAPDLAVEVLSPWDSTSEVIAKLQMYKEAGVPLIWLVDPEKMTVTVIAAGKSTKVLQSNDTLDGDDILPGFAVPVVEIFV